MKNIILLVIVALGTLSLGACGHKKCCDKNVAACSK